MMPPIPLHQFNPTERFSNRAEDYRKYRPTYPEAAIAFLLSDLPLKATIVDVGAGTGISSRLLAQQETGAAVIALEPNAAMRQVGELESILLSSSHLTFQSGTAEATGLSDRSVDLVTAFQAFHWFDHRVALPEFHRILKPGGKLAVVWNNRDRGDVFTTRYGEALRSVLTQEPEQRLDIQPLLEDATYFGVVQGLEVSHQQALDLTSLLGLANSRSYTPRAGEAATRLMQQLTDLYEEHVDEQGYVYLQYKTNVYLATRRD
ncbi:MAG: class I SAM-dependent methyltransferase [Synechococcales bacterium]|nr:class I SAM-dependent methyltransferase [Synechococcales bacterium]